MRTVLLCLAAVPAAAFAAASGLMIAAALRRPPADATVIVPGARVCGDQPCRMLRDRLSAAADYLKAHPASNCVVSGGQGADENQSEASVMKAFLLTQGIAPERIREEGRSVNTSENLRFSAAIIEREGWSRRTVVATQEFHQFRTQFFALRAGLKPAGPCLCRSPLHRLLPYWFREVAAVYRALLFGN